MGVSYYESPAYMVVRSLRKKGYEIANTIGIRENEPDQGAIGILKPKHPVEKGFWVFRRKVKQRALFIGTLWFDNEARGARPDKRWVLEVYGREHVQELMKLAKELAKTYAMDIHVVLRRERPELETYPSDFDL